MTHHPCSSIYIKEWGTQKLFRRSGISYPTPHYMVIRNKKHFFSHLDDSSVLEYIANLFLPWRKFQSPPPWDSYLAAWTLKPREGEQHGSHSSPSSQALFHPCLALCHHNPIILPSFPKSWAVLFQREKVLVTCILNIQSFVQNRWQGLLAPNATSIPSAVSLNFPFLSAGPEASTFWGFWDLVRWIDFLTTIF